jgi:hypothetical protein
MLISGNGTKLVEPFYVGPLLFGADHGVRVTYNPYYDSFLAVWQHTFIYGNTGTDLMLSVTRY